MARVLTSLAVLLAAQIAQAQPVGPDPIAPTRAYVAKQIADEHALVERTLVTVDEKLREASAARVRRARVAARVLASDGAIGADSSTTRAVARRRAAARLVLAIDRREAALLAAEQVALHGGLARTAAMTAAAATTALPPTALPWPAAGEVVREFGSFEHPASKATLRRNGLELATRPQAEVRAIAAGTVIYAGPIRGLDHGIILDHGGYFTVTGKLGELEFSEGARIDAGELLGRAARARVTLELRLALSPAGLPVDPRPFLVAR